MKGMNEMIQSFINTITPLIANTDSVQFTKDCIRTRGCDSWLCHNCGSANYDIVCGGIYEITFNASVSSATVLLYSIFHTEQENATANGLRTKSTASAMGINPPSLFTISKSQGSRRQT